MFIFDADFPQLTFPCHIVNCTREVGKLSPICFKDISLSLLMLLIDGTLLYLQFISVILIVQCGQKN